MSYKVTAMVSVYNAEEFMRACLEDLVRQSIFPQIEVIVVDACSPQNERDIAMDFVSRYPNISYIRTQEREPLYAAWNRIISMAKGEYLTSANADDRHAPYALERLAHELDKNQNIALVYADSRITNVKNAIFETAPLIGHFHWLDYDHLNVIRQCEMGSQPLWRRSVHAELGLFNEQYQIAGDYDMWLRISARYRFLHIPEELGLYLQYDNNLEKSNIKLLHREVKTMRFQAIEHFMSDNFTPHSPLEQQWQWHKQEINRMLKNPENINNVKLLEFHFYACALLAAKIDKIAVALDITELALKLLQNKKSMRQLHGFLLRDGFK